MFKVYRGHDKDSHNEQERKHKAIFPRLPVPAYATGIWSFQITIFNREFMRRNPPYAFSPSRCSTNGQARDRYSIRKRGMRVFIHREGNVVSNREFAEERLR